MRREARMRELFWLLLVAGLLTDLGSLLFPSFGPFKMFGLESRGGFLPDMERLFAGRDWDFRLANLTGVVNFPSFHTVMSLAYTSQHRAAGETKHPPQPGA